VACVRWGNHAQLHTIAAARYAEASEAAETRPPYAAMGVGNEVRHESVEAAAGCLPAYC